MLCGEWKNMKISKGLSNNKNMVFNMKKLSNVGVDLTLWRRGERKRFGGMSSRYCGFMAANDQFSLANVSTSMSTNGFLDSMHTPSSRGRILMEITPFSGFSAGLSRQNRLVAVCGIRVSGGQPPYWPDLNSLDSSLSCVL
jgi:hypothetical protein